MKRLIFGFVLGVVAGLTANVAAQYSGIGRPGGIGDFYKETAQSELFDLQVGEGMIEYQCYNSFYVIRYNDAGTIRFKYLDLSGTTTTWQQSTSSPCTTRPAPVTPDGSEPQR